MAPLNCTIPIHIVYKGIQATTPFVLAYGRRLKKKKKGKPNTRKAQTYLPRITIKTNAHSLTPNG